MRNLKRVLSLGLASVMLLGMTVMGASAASKDFTDASEIKNTEAVSVLTALGVMEGTDKGAFNPKGVLTREQAAKIIAVMLLGDEADKVATNSVSFKDVAADRWSAGYIGYCAQAGILAGDGTGNFNPEGELTGLSFAKMLLVALGYDPAIEEYVGNDWAVNVAAGAVDAGISPKGLVLANALTREDAAQMAFQTLTANTVKYSNKGTTIIGSDGMQVIVGASAPETIYAANDYRTTKDDQDAIQQFCEKYFTNLKKDTGKADDFKRPADYKWTLNKKDVYSATKEATLTYAGADFDKDAIADLKEDYKKVDEAPIYYNGDEIANVDELSELNRNGYNIEIYANSDDEVTDIVVTEGFFSQVTAVNTNDDDEVTSIEVTVYDAGEGETSLEIDAKDNEDAFALVKGLEEDDVFMGYYTTGWADGDADKLLAVDTDVETLDGKVTATSIDAKYNGWAKIDGEKYDFAWNYSQAKVTTGSEGTFYLYNGYLVHFDGSTAQKEGQYVYVVRGGAISDEWGSKTYTAEVVFPDGTCEVVDVDANEAVTAGLYSYKYSEKNANYTLTKVGENKTVSIEKGKTAIKDSTGTVATANSKTVFVNVKLDGTKFDDATVYTGYRNVGSMEDVKAYIVTGDKSTVATYVFIVDGKVTGTSDDLIYIAGESVSDKIDDADLGEYYTYTAVVNGEVVEIMVDAATENAGTLNGLYSSATVDEDGIYSDLKGAAAEDYTFVDNTNFKRAENEVITIGENVLSYSDDVTVFVTATNGKITAGSIDRNYSDVDVYYTTNNDGEVNSLYIVRQ